MDLHQLAEVQTETSAERTDAFQADARLPGRLQTHSAIE